MVALEKPDTRRFEGFEDFEALVDPGPFTGSIMELDSPLSSFHFKKVLERFEPKVAKSLHLSVWDYADFRMFSRAEMQYFMAIRGASSGDILHETCFDILMCKQENLERGVSYIIFENAAAEKSSLRIDIKRPS